MPASCWWCGKPMTRFPSRPNAGALFTDPIGNVHVVHKCCLKSAELDGKKLTAQPPEEFTPRFE